MTNVFKDHQIACIADIHLGIHSDARQWHEISLDFARWLAETLKARGIEDIFIAGDLFHDRHEIGVNTIHVAYEFFEILKDFNIMAITGNHDCFYKDKSDVNSISILNGEKIRVFQEMTTVNEYGKTITFCPWGTSISNIPESDVIFGHFEILNFKMNSVKICCHGDDGANLLDKSKMIISGHFHYRDHREYENGGEILYLGSPFELDWGDCGQTKGVTILDLKTLKTEFIENKITPKHIKVHTSNLLSNSSQLEKYKQMVPGNIVRIVVDRKISEKTVDLLLTKFNQLKPLQISTEFIVGLNGEYYIIGEMEKTCIDIDSALSEYINLLKVDRVEKSDIYKKCYELYKTSQDEGTK